MSRGRKRYLFIRLLEACNADCFMCSYALSRDRYRFGPGEFSELLPAAHALGVRFVRFTGGEPLMHREITGLVQAGSASGMKMSIITNGSLLPRKIEALARSGLAQVIVSIDGATANSHNRIRNTAGLFERGIAGLQMANDAGVLTRVNTVVGPHNYREMPAVQKLLTDCQVAQWELTAIKLNRPILYGDPADVLANCEPIYAADPAKSLVPMGGRFYGDTSVEQTLFFTNGCSPRPRPPYCELVGDVIYLDAKSGRGYGCSLLPHRDEHESGGGAVMRHNGIWMLDTNEFRQHVEHFRVAGPRVCTGCSTTAAGYSDAVKGKPEPADWAY